MAFSSLSLFYSFFTVGELPPLLRASGPPLPIPSRDTAHHIEGPESESGRGKSISLERVKKIIYFQISQDQERRLEEIREDLERRNIKLQVSYSPTLHDREIR